MNKSFSPRKPKRRAMALVEFALVLPVVLFILMGIIEMGFLVKNQLMLSNAVRDSARYAALGNSSTNVRTRLKNEAGLLNPKLTDAQIILERSLDPTATTPIYYSWPPDSSVRNNVPVGNLIRVRVSYPHRTLTSFIPFLNNRPINVAVTMMREAN